MRQRLQAFGMIAAGTMVMLVSTGTEAQALIIQYDRATFDSLYPGSVLENWDGFPSGTLLNNGSEVNGITYNSGVGTAVVTNSFSNTTAPNGLGLAPNGFFLSTDSITFAFKHALTAFGIDINTFSQGGSITATTSNGDSINSLFDPFPGSPTGEFLGFFSDTEFSSITLAGVGANNFSLDTLRGVESSSTPIPTPALLPGLIGMGVAALRKSKQEAETEA